MDFHLVLGESTGEFVGRVPNPPDSSGQGEHLACDTIQETLEGPEEGKHEPKSMDKKCFDKQLRLQYG